MDYKIISDGCCDLTKEIIDQYELHIVPFYISFDETNYYKEIEEIGIRDVYERMVKNPDVFPKTSLPSVQNYIDVFTEYAKENMPVICLCLTPSLSGSYNCACNAKEIVCEDYPDAKITVVNSESATVSQGLMVIEAARMREDGVSYEECIAILEKMKKSSRIFFTVGDTEYLKHGGRIGKLAGIASSALSLKPLITLADGSIDSSGIGRSRKKTVSKTITLLDNYFKENGDAMEEYAYCVGVGYDLEEGRQYYDTITKHIYGESSVDKVGFCQIGATIAVHTGPYAIGIGCVKKYENCR
ncbi:MAG: DegV family protein [Lachnospiraceae bacterium]|nr:DegV family protein [Lachnospiraceae bacterium]MDY5496723.1 DegV family protein [Anaerobutyricum sp.]